MDQFSTPDPRRANFTAATLTPAQLDGIACVVCHGEDGAMVPVGSTEHGQLFACVGHDRPDARTAVSA